MGGGGGVMIGIGFLLTGFLIYMQTGYVILTTSRIPIFILGCIAGYYYAMRKPIKNVTFCCVLSLIVLIIEIFLVGHFGHIYLWRNAIYWLPFFIITPGLCLCLCYIIKMIEKDNILKWIGGLSLEAYLIHIIILKRSKDWMMNFINGETIKAWLVFILFSLVVMGISYLLHIVYNKAIYNRLITKH